MMKTAVVQMCPAFKDMAGNLRRLVALVTQAAQGGAELIVLPELATTGYSFMTPQEAAPFAEVVADFRPGEERTSSLGQMYALASKHHVHIVWGFVEKDLGTGDLYNSQALITPEGEFVTYRKINFFANDFLWAKPGRANPPILKCDFKDGSKRVGLLICRDVRDKVDDSWTNLYSQGDADVVCLSAAWGNGGFPATAWMDFVKENNTTLAISNRYGDEGGKPNEFSGGGVCIITPKGTPDHPNGVYCDGLLWNQDCIVFAEI